MGRFRVTYTAVYDSTAMIGVAYRSLLREQSLLAKLKVS